MRKSYRCRFNSYVGLNNRDSIVSSIISQFQGYDCDLEATLDGEDLIVSLNLVNGLSNTLVRDKLSFNYFIESVKTADIIKKRKMSLPAPVSSWIESKVVNKELMAGDHEGDRDDPTLEQTEGVHKGIANLATLFGESGFNVTGSDQLTNSIVPPFSGVNDSIDPDLLSDINNLTAFRRMATEQDAGGLAGFGGGIEQTNVEESLDAPRETKEPRGSILGIDKVNAWFTDDILAGETVKLKPKPRAEAPLALPTGSKKGLGLEDSALEEPGASQGGEVVPGEPIKGWATAFKQQPTYFGLNDDYESNDSNDYEV